MIIRRLETTLYDTTVSLAGAENEISLNFEFSFEDDTATVDVVVECLNGQAVLRRGSQEVFLTKNASNTASIQTASVLRLAIQTPPSGAASGFNFAQQPVVRVVDDLGTLFTGATGTVSVTLATGTGQLAGTTSATVANGVATFSNLRITGAGSHSLRFSAPDVAPVTSTVFPVSSAILSFNTTLLGGVVNARTLGPASVDRGYIVEINPLNGVTSFGLEVNRVLPQWDGNQWNDVLELRTSALHPPLDVNVRVYDTGALPLASNFTANLSPGVLHGFSLGSTTQARGYVAEITPISETAADFQTIFIQPEWNGATWNDVIRIQTRPESPPIQANVRVYSTVSLPVATEFTTTLQPGGFEGFNLGPASANQAFVVEVSPLSSPGGVQINRIQPEWDGTTWFDVLRLGTIAQDPPIQIHVRVYRITP